MKLPAFLLAGLAAAALASDTTGTLLVRVAGIRAGEGVLRISLFQTPAGYPEDFSRAARTLSIAATDSVLSARIDSLPPGTWAISVLHDRNSDGRLDRGLLGVPREGIGASNAAHLRWGPPRFRDARFEFRGGISSLRIVLKHW